MTRSLRYMTHARFLPDGGENPTTHYPKRLSGQEALLEDLGTIHAYFISVYP